MNQILVPLARSCGIALGLFLLADGALYAASPPGVQENAFLAENAAAMSTMMSGMNIQASGDIDRDFVNMMVPHHQGAIDMAVAELRYGRNEQVRRLAQEIIVTQQEEIAALHLAIGDKLPPSIPSPTMQNPPMQMQ